AYGWGNDVDDFTKIINFLRQREEQVLVLTNVNSKIDSSQPIYEDWIAQSKKTRLFLLQLSLNLPQANLIFAKEVVTSGNLHDSPLATMTKHVREGIVLDPQITFNFSHLDTFLERIEEKIFNPFSNIKLYFKGASISSGRVVNMINQLAFEKTGKYYQTVAAPVRVVADNFPFIYEEMSDFGDFTPDLYSLLSGRDLPLESIEKRALGFDLTKMSSLVDDLTNYAVVNDELGLPLPGSGVQFSPEEKQETYVQEIKTTSKNNPSDDQLDQFLATNDLLTSKSSPEDLPAELSFLKEGLISPVVPTADLAPSAPVVSSNNDVFMQTKTEVVVESPPLLNQEVMAIKNDDVKIIEVDDGALDNFMDSIIVSAPPNDVYVAATPDIVEDVVIVEEPEVVLVEESTPLKQKVRVVDSDSEKVIDDREQQSQSTKKVEKRRKISFKKPDLQFIKDFRPGKFHFAGVAILLLVGVYFGLNAIFGSNYYRDLTNFISNCQTMEDCIAYDNVEILRSSTERQQSDLARFFSNNNEQQQVVLGESLIDLIVAQQRVYDDAQELYRAIFNQSEANVVSQAQVLQGQLELLSEEIVSTQEQFLVVRDGLLNSETAQTLPIFENMLAELRREIVVLNRFLPIVAELARQDRYVLAINLLDNRELRAGGGTNLGVSILEFNYGRVGTRQFYSAAEIDGRVGGDISPPAELAALNEAISGGFAQGTWSTDSLINATASSNLLQLALGRNVDGVAYIDLISYANLLGATSPLTIEEHNLVIDGDNIFTSLGMIDDMASGRRTAFVNSLQSGLFDKLENAEPSAMPRVLSVLADGFNSKNIYWVSLDADLASILVESGYSGQIASPTCPAQLGGQECIIEAFYQVDTNFGAPINSYVVRSINHNIELLPTQIVHERSITYQNRYAGTNVHAYENYIQFFIPDDAESIEVTVDGSPTALDDQNGLAISVESGQNMIVRISFYIPHEFSSESFTYSFFNQKQVGVMNSTLNITLRNSLPGAVRRVAPRAVVDGRRIRFSSNEEENFLLGVVF
ncbi:MAG: DUF4012 domain-containing protein, partial [Pseudomonadales bacterium]|nr:DUF4012 domain-containing protein [Pseudomonadales bacterium]